VATQPLLAPSAAPLAALRVYIYAWRYPVFNTSLASPIRLVVAIDVVVSSCVALVLAYNIYHADAHPCLGPHVSVVIVEQTDGAPTFISTPWSQVKDMYILETSFLRDYYYFKEKCTNFFLGK
jgi:hypothetical protein